MVSLNSLKVVLFTPILTVFLCHFGIQGQPMSREEAREALLKIGNEDARDVWDYVLERILANIAGWSGQTFAAWNVPIEIRIRNLPFVDFDQECTTHLHLEATFPYGEQPELGKTYQFAQYRENILERYSSGSYQVCNPFKNLYCKGTTETSDTGKCKCEEGAYYMIGHKRSTPSGKAVDPRDMCVLHPGQRCDVDSDEETNDDNFDMWPREQFDIFSFRLSSIPKTPCEFYNAKPACSDMNYISGKFCFNEDIVKKSKELRNHFTQASTLTIGQPCNLQDHTALYEPEMNQALEDRFNILDSLISTDAKFCSVKSFLYCSPITETCEPQFPEFQDKNTGKIWAWPFLFNTCEALGNVRDVLYRNQYVDLEEGTHYIEGIPKCPEKYKCAYNNICFCPDQKSIGKNCDERAMTLLKSARKSGIAFDAASEDEQLTLMSRLNQVALQFEGKFTIREGQDCKLNVNDQARSVARRLNRFRNTNILWAKSEIEKLTNDIEKISPESDYCQHGLHPYGETYGRCYQRRCRVENHPSDDIRRLAKRLKGFKTLTCGQSCHTLDLNELRGYGSQLKFNEQVELLEDLYENKTEFCTTGLICQPSSPDAPMGECVCSTPSADCCAKAKEDAENIKKTRIKEENEDDDHEEITIRKGNASTHSHLLTTWLVGVILAVLALRNKNYL